MSEFKLEIKDHLKKKALHLAETTGISLEQAMSIISKKHIEDNCSLFIEKEILKDLVSAWNKFVELDRYHPSELNEFSTAVHTLQQLIGMRILNREHPEIFPRICP